MDTKDKIKYAMSSMNLLLITTLIYNIAIEIEASPKWVKYRVGGWECTSSSLHSSLQAQGGKIRNYILDQSMNEGIKRVEVILGISVVKLLY